MPGHKNLLHLMPGTDKANRAPTLVSTILDHSPKRWNIPLVQQLFPPSIAVDILKIMIPTNPARDCLLWKHEKKGLYSVKSRYQLIKRQELHTIFGESSRSTKDGKVWRKLWKMNMPNKLKVFAWWYG